MITTTQVTQHHLSQQEADKVFTEAYKEATGAIIEMSLN
jgi:hypothetical protein